MSDVQVIAGSVPQPVGGLVAADQKTIFGDGSAGHPLTTNGGTAGGGGQYTAQANRAVLPGELLQPASVFQVTPGTHLVEPLAAPATLPHCGMALGAQATVGGDFTAQYNGIVTLTTAEWDAVAGTTGGLNRQTTYYADRSTAGHITSTAPTSGQAEVVAGIALNSTQLLLILGPRTIVA